THRARGQRPEIGPGIESEIIGIHVEIVDVAENAAARATRKLGQELALGNGRMPEAQVSGWILDQDPPSQHALRLVDMGTDDLETLFGVGERQKVVQVNARQAAPREMLGDEVGIDAVDQLAQARKVLSVEPARATEREADAVDADGIIAAKR